MTEINNMHELTLEWGCITNLMNKISDIEDKIGWPELADMVADAVTVESQNTDPATVFFSLYQFLWRLYYRLKANPEKSPFNRWTKYEDQYWATNYDYALFKWAHENGFVEGIDNLVIRVPANKLSDKHKRALDRRCEQEKGGK